jgi:hypothetical protein
MAAITSGVKLRKVSTGAGGGVNGRGAHSSTYQLNLSRF